MIELSAVSRHYGVVRAVDAVSLHIPAGQVWGLIGHNGAGKSTLLKMMLGLIPASAGEIRIAGEAVGSARFRPLRQSIGYLPENVMLYEHLSGLETLRFFARLKSADPAQCPLLLEQLGLSHAMQRAVREYSKGMRQRLGFAQALLGTPRLLVLDEPTNGLDPLAIHHFYDTLAALKQQGCTILLSSHLLAEIEPRVDALAILAEGKRVACGTVAELSAQAHLPAHVRLRVQEAETASISTTLQRQDWQLRVLSPGQLALTVPHAEKRALLTALAALGETLLAYEIHEPTLEDIFLQRLPPGKVQGEVAG